MMCVFLVCFRDLIRLVVMCCTFVVALGVIPQTEIALQGSGAFKAAEGPLPARASAVVNKMILAGISLTSTLLTPLKTAAGG